MPATKEEIEAQVDLLCDVVQNFISCDHNDEPTVTALDQAVEDERATLLAMIGELF